MKIPPRLRQFVSILRGTGWYPPRDYTAETLHLGSSYGGWTILPQLLSSKSIVYSFGVGEDISFDLELIGRYGCAIHAFDPTPKSLRWIEEQTLPREFVMHQYALARTDGALELFAPANAEHASYSSLAGSAHLSGSSISVPAKRLDTIMRELGHSRVDLVKMDIEGAEYGVIDSLERGGIAPLQLLIEFHHRFAGAGLPATKRAVNRLRELGYLLYNVSASGEDFSFVLASEVKADGGGIEPAKTPP